VDRPLDEQVVRGRARRRLLLASGLVALATFAFAWGPRLLRPHVERDRVRIATVDTGPLEAALSAAGRVVPEVEQVLTSPVDARVLRVRRRAGDAVRAGETLVELDLSEARLAVAALDRDLALKRNEERRQRLSLESSLNDVESRHESKRLELDARRASLERSRQLRASGLVSEQELKEAELRAAQAEIELRQLDESRRLARASSAAEVEGLSLEIANLESRRQEAWRELQRGSARAEHDGVVTWTVSEEGATVRKGEPVARLADLSAFRVEGTLSDVNASRLALGQPVRVRIEHEDDLLGEISAIDPTIRDGVLTFTVALENKSHPALRPNLRVDVYVLVQRKADVLRVPRGPFASGEGVQNVFVVHGREAERTRVRLGLASPTHFEVLEGLRPGDQVIVSDMSDYLYARKVAVR
jgi:HlyD family secretion protein